MGRFHIFTMAVMVNLAPHPSLAPNTIPQPSVESSTMPTKDGEAVQSVGIAPIATESKINEGKCHWWDLYVWHPDYVVIHLEAKGKENGGPQVISTTKLRNKPRRERRKEDPPLFCRVHHLYFSFDPANQWLPRFSQSLIAPEDGKDCGNLNREDIVHSPASDSRLPLYNKHKEEEGFDRPTHIGFHFGSKSTRLTQIVGLKPLRKNLMKFDVTHHIYYQREGPKMTETSGTWKSSKYAAHPKHYVYPQEPAADGSTKQKKRVRFYDATVYHCSSKLFALPYVAQEKKPVVGVKSVRLFEGKEKGPEVLANMDHWGRRFTLVADRF